MRQRQEPTPPSINDRVNSIAGDQRFATSRPSQTHLDAYAIAADEFAGALDRLKALLEETRQIEVEMEKVGAPWTPGRIPEWHK